MNSAKRKLSAAKSCSCTCKAEFRSCREALPAIHASMSSSTSRFLHSSRINMGSLQHVKLSDKDVPAGVYLAGQSDFGYNRSLSDSCIIPLSTRHSIG